MALPSILCTLAMLLMPVQGGGREEWEECSRCQPLQYDPFGNYLWYFYQVHKFYCPEDDDDPSHTECSLRTDVWMNGMDEMCQYPKQNWGWGSKSFIIRQHKESIDNCWLQNEIIGFRGYSALLGALILLLIIFGPFLLCCCCWYCKKRHNKQRDIPMGQIKNTEVVENESRTDTGKTLLPQPDCINKVPHHQPSAPPGYNLVPLADTSALPVPPGFKLIPLAELQAPPAPSGYKLIKQY